MYTSHIHTEYIQIEAAEGENEMEAKRRREAKAEEKY